MTLIDNQMPVAGNPIVDCSSADEALNHSHVELAVRSAFAATDLTDAALIDTEEHRKLRDPLVEERLPVNEDQYATRTLRDQVGAEYRLANAGRTNENADVVRE
jgi:hypothetical protein